MLERKKFAVMYFDSILHSGSLVISSFFIHSGRYYYWDEENDVVSWLPPSHPRALITDSAAHFREERHTVEDKHSDDEKKSDSEDGSSSDSSSSVDVKRQRRRYSSSDKVYIYVHCIFIFFWIGILNSN